jgi:arsenate reductase
MRLLFLCTHNACRSILCEAIARRLAADRIEVASAGSQPSGQIHPLTLDFLTRSGYPVTDLCSKAIDEVESFAPDAVIMVCDDAASEGCPVWLGSVAKAHWGLPDPSRLKGSEHEIEAAFCRVVRTIEGRINRLLREPFEDMQTVKLTELFNCIGEQD